MFTQLSIGYVNSFAGSLLGYKLRQFTDVLAVFPFKNPSLKQKRGGTGEEERWEEGLGGREGGETMVGMEEGLGGREGREMMVGM